MIISSKHHMGFIMGFMGKNSKNSGKDGFYVLFYVRLDDFARDLESEEHIFSLRGWRRTVTDLDFLSAPCAQGINMSCLDEIGSEVVQSQWNKPARYSTARSKLPETKR